MHFECMGVYSRKEREIQKSKLLVLFSVGDSKLAFSLFTTVRSWTLPQPCEEDLALGTGPTSFLPPARLDTAT